MSAFPGSGLLNLAKGGKMLKNYEDSKCVYGYMTLCEKCTKNAPPNVNVNKEVKGFPTPQCEMCKGNGHSVSGGNA